MLRKMVQRRPSPSMIVALIALLVAVGGTAYATGEGDPILGGERNPSNNPSQALTKETQIIANLSGYGTRQSNKSSSGGGAIYGCRSGAGGTAAGNRPCIRANNLSSGSAFEFATTGTQGGLITTGNANGRPFTTNATAVATGLNADRLDGKDAADFLGKTETAATATTAANVNGVVATKILFNAPENTAATTIYSAGGLTLQATCAASGNATLTIQSSKDDAMGKWYFLNAASTNAWADGDGAGTGTGKADEDDDLDAADAPRILTGWDDSAPGHISYLAPDGATVDISLSAEEGGFGAQTCQVSGTALAG
jgi:hypothetical protein